MSVPEGYKTKIHYSVPVARDPKCNMVQSFEKARAVAHERGYAPFMTAIWDQMSASIDAKRNLAAQHFLRTDCEWMMMVDDDMDFRHNTAAIVDLLDVAFETGAKIVAPLMVRRSPPHYVCFNENRGKPDSTASAVQGIKAGVNLDCNGHVGTGCILIHRNVFETVPQPWFITKMTDKCRHCLYLEGATLDPNCKLCGGSGKNPEGHRIEVGEDTFFCRNAVDAGFKVVCALGVTVGHLGEASLTIEDSVRLQDPVAYARAVLKFHDNLVKGHVEREGLIVPGPGSDARKGTPSLVVASR